MLLLEAIIISAAGDAWIFADEFFRRQGNDFYI